MRNGHQTIGQQDGKTGRQAIGRSSTVRGGKKVKIAEMKDIHRILKTELDENHHMTMDTLVKGQNGNGKTVQGILSSEMIAGNGFGSAVTMRDAYDRVVENEDKESFLVNEEKEKGLSSETLNRLSEVVNADNFDMYEAFGLAPDKDDPTSILTVSERIEIELATACKDYVPTGNISLQDLESMYGKTGRAYTIARELSASGVEPDREKVEDMEKTLDQVAELCKSGISSGMAEYLVVNNKPLSVDNVYKASHAVISHRMPSGQSTSGYGAFGSSVAFTQSNVYQPLSDSDWESLKPQVEGVLQKVGFTPDDDMMADARWMVETKLPVTGENMERLSQIREINRQFEEQGFDETGWIKKLSADRAFYDTAGGSSLNYYHTVEADSIEAVTILNEGTDDQVAALVMDGNEVTLLNLKRLQEERTRETVEQRGRIREQDAVEEKIQTQKQDEKLQKKLVTAQRTLEEARLRLTVSSGAFLIKNGFYINIASLSDTVDRLRAIENRLTEEVFASVGYEASVENVEMYGRTISAVRDFSSVPSYVLGGVFAEQIEFNVTAMTDYGNSQAFKMSVAGMAYDTLGTKPDRALGDSLSNAFGNIPEMLKEMEIEDTVMNQRAVRILAHNELPFTRKNIDRMKEMDTEVSRMIDNLTPKTTAYLIANGINPLHTDIRQLNEVLEQINSQIGKDEVEKYSEYLYKLERKGELTDEEREAYVGIYRALHMIEKADKRAIGLLAKQGGELTMGNLLTAARSFANGGMEVTIDDELGITEETMIAANNIDRQLKLFESSAFYRRAREHLSPALAERVLQREDREEKSPLDEAPEQFFRQLSDASFEPDFQAQNRQEERALNASLCREIEQLQIVSEETLSYLMEDQMTANMQNLLGLSAVLNGGKTIYDRILSAAEDTKVQEDLERLGKLIAGEGEDLQGELPAQAMETMEALETSADSLNTDLREVLMGRASIRAEEVRSLTKATAYMKLAAKNHSYYVPLAVNGENTLLKLTMKRDEEQKGRIDIRLATAEEITVSLQAQLDSGGLVLTERFSTGVTREWLSDTLKEVQEICRQNTANVEEPDGDETADYAQLFQAAKEVVRKLSSLVNERISR